MAIKFIDLFCGIGGFRIAFEKYGCECVFSSDIDKYARETYKLNFGEYPEGDITKIQSEKIPDFDILCAGFPCQPFSIAGKRLGFDDTRGTLFFDVARILKEKQPEAFILENVRGLANHDGGKTLNVIEKTLDGLGYSHSWKIINARDCGIPQNRERWYCVGFKNYNIDNFAWPTKRKMLYELSDIISHTVGAEYNVSEICMNNVYSNAKSKGITINNNTLAYEIRPSRCQFACNNYSPCLTAKMGTGGNNVPVVVSQKRKLTESECLQIMGYPKSYKMSHNCHSYKQIGNSVVVPVIEILAENIVNTIGEIKDESNR